MSLVRTQSKILHLLLGQLLDRVEGAKPADVTQSVRKYAAQKPSASRVPSAKVEPASEVPPVIKKVNNL
jgi:hypothetical protein